MKAIVPVNVAALRISSTDSTNVTPRAGFNGRTAAFDLLPHGSQATQASTGDTIWIPLGSGSPSVPLETGVHLHWELPEFFKRGHADSDLGTIVFPHAPTRWLVVRSLSSYDQASGSYGAPRQASWVVESDYVTAELQADQHNITRAAIPVPLTAPDNTPYMFMGRVVDAASWNPASENPADYLPHYTGPGGTPLYLTSVGFTGAAFSGYYPDCRSVFGFWDTFADVSDIYQAITQNNPVKFRVSYTVIGWLPDAATDQLSGLAAAVTAQYNQYVSQAVAEQAKVTTTPADVFADITANQYGWQFSANAVSYTLAADQMLASLDVPDGMLCAGVIQEVVWDQTNPATDTPFLAAPTMGQPWTDQVEIAIGNTTVEAASALVKSHLAAPGGNDSVLSSYETLLNALQLGVLRDLEGQGNALATLEQTLHERAFSQIDGGHQWTIQTKAAPEQPGLGRADAPARASRTAFYAEQRAARLRPGAVADHRGPAATVHGLGHLRQAALPQAIRHQCGRHQHARRVPGYLGRRRAAGRHQRGRRGRLDPLSERSGHRADHRRDRGRRDEHPGRPGGDRLSGRRLRAGRTGRGGGAAGTTSDPELGARRRSRRSVLATHRPGAGDGGQPPRAGAPQWPYRLDRGAHGQRADQRAAARGRRGQLDRADDEPARPAGTARDAPRGHRGSRRDRRGGPAGPAVRRRDRRGHRRRGQSRAGRRDRRLPGRAEPARPAGGRRALRRRPPGWVPANPGPGAVRARPPRRSP